MNIHIIASINCYSTFIIDNKNTKEGRLFPYSLSLNLRKLDNYGTDPQQIRAGTASETSREYTRTSDKSIHLFFKKWMPQNFIADDFFFSFSIMIAFSLDSVQRAASSIPKKLGCSFRSRAFFRISSRIVFFRNMIFRKLVSQMITRELFFRKIFAQNFSS